MKVVLSKKGFDSTYGGHPSIIDGADIYSMPIPAKNEPCTYGELHVDSSQRLFDIAKTYYKSIFEGDTKRDFAADLHCHPDPNLTNYFNETDFLGSIGQVDKAQGHLENQGVAVGDLFLFFGRFREVKGGKFVGSDKHTILGYLQIGEIIYTAGLSPAERSAYENKYPWLKQQPHWVLEKYSSAKNNCIYVAAEKLTFAPDLKGYGTFAYNAELDLTKPLANKCGEWCLPAPLSNLHISSCGGRVTAENGEITLPATFGQEYVIEESPKVENWAAGLIKK